ncbi:inhibitor of apoptosis-promoting Bax1-domain-containing protein [Obelidium mucronatum]|nr:inhibitor of apoptosis-promoting Bax1-domain-containing protein [Obelidium mucronatum]
MFSPIPLRAAALRHQFALHHSLTGRVLVPSTIACASRSLTTETSKAGKPDKDSTDQEAANEAKNKPPVMMGFWSKPPSKTWIVDVVDAVETRTKPLVQIMQIDHLSKINSKQPNDSSKIDSNSDAKSDSKDKDPRTSANKDQSSNTNDKPPAPPSRFVLGLITSASIIGAGAYGIDHFCNRIPRRKSVTLDVLSENEFLQDYINQTFHYVGGALALTATSALLFSKVLAALPAAKSKMRIHGFHPLTFLGSLAATAIFTNWTLSTPASKYTEKHYLFLATAISKGVFLSSTIAIAPALLTRVGLYAAGVVGSISWIAATAKSDHYIYIGGPLLTGLTVTTLAAMSRFLLPPASMALPLYQLLWVYCGTTVFAGFVLKDTAKIVSNGQKVERGEKKMDLINEALKLYLDVVNVLP